MQYYSSVKDLFVHICEIKKSVLKLELPDLKIYKRNFYSQKLPMYCLDLFWEYIWGDIEYEFLFEILKSRKKI